MTVVQSNSLATSPAQLEFRDLGRMDYRSALELQREIQREVIEARDGDRKMVVLMVEHDPPVITVSRRPGARKHLTASEAQLRAAGVEVCETDRGGDITYHGPGQLVVYPILDLNALNLRMISYLRFLEQVVIDTLAQFNIQGVRDESATGVWVRDGHAPQDAHLARDANPLEWVGFEGDASRPAPHASKICAIGVRVSRWVSMHGLALNVATNLDHFHLIVPCGLAGRSVTSMRQVLGEDFPEMPNVKRVLMEMLGRTVVQAGNGPPVSSLHYAATSVAMAPPGDR